MYTNETAVDDGTGSGPRVLCFPQKTDYFPYYQPIVHLETGNVAGYEALARTRNEDGRVISAASIFFEEEFPQDWVREIDRHIRWQALQYFARVRTNEFITLNISPAWVDQLGSKTVSPTLSMIESAGIDPRRVVIEVTERSGNMDNLKRITREYQQAGVRVAVDDFGAGASQVDRIVALNPDFIKLDMGLFKAASRGGSAADIALAITSMAKRAGCEIICEGVENRAEFDFSVECGADLVQGWLYAPALGRNILPDSLAVQTNEYKGQYLERKAASHKRAFAQQLAVKHKVRCLRDWINACGDLMSVHHTFSGADFRQLGVQRFYVCNMQGTQVSANYEFGEGNIQLQTDFVGRNWSHRPYFARLVGVRSLAEDPLVVSDIYRDIRNGDMCKTYAISLNSKEILMLDVLVQDLVLFAQ